MRTRSPLLRRLEEIKGISAVLAAEVLTQEGADHIGGALVFTVDTFTSDELTITIPVSLNTLDATGGAPAGKDLFLVDVTSLNTAWVLGTTHGFSGDGQIGASAMNPSNSAVFDNTSAGDVVRMTFNSNFSAGSTVMSEVTASWTGSNIFNPSAVDNLLLTWGTDGIGSVYPFGDPQGTTVVPEPEACALVVVGASLLLVIGRRRTLASQRAVQPLGRFCVTAPFQVCHC